MGIRSNLEGKLIAIIIVSGTFLAMLFMVILPAQQNGISQACCCPNGGTCSDTYYNGSHCIIGIGELRTAYKIECNLTLGG